MNKKHINLFLRTKSIALFVLMLIALSGCCSKSGDFPFARMAPMAPPPPVPEERIQTDDPQGEIWKPGYWYYDGFSFNWVTGTLVLRPDPTATWMPDRWELRAYGWAFIPGYWL